MTQIPVVVETNCGAHPLLRSGDPLPRQVSIRLSVERLFGLGALKLQDPNVGRRTYTDTFPLWENLNNMYGVYLEFSANDLTAKASSEQLTEISEIVGIGCGLAALLSQFAINVNRITRFTSPGGKKRTDFEFPAKKGRYVHEAKGTTYQGKIPQLRNDILAQKNASIEFCQKNRPLLTASTGSITLYQHASRKEFSSQILLLDPPTDADGTSYSESEELSSVLRYYANFYSVTHVDPQNDRPIGLRRWLAEVIKNLDAGLPAPKKPPERLLTRGRSGDPDVPSSLYRGTIFDSRIADDSVRRYGTFDEASATIKNPLIFIGISEEVTELVRSCDWERLLEFSDNTAFAVNEIEGTTVFESGVMSKQAKTNEEIENASRNAFVTLRAKAEWEGRTLNR